MTGEEARKHLCALTEDGRGFSNGCASWKNDRRIATDRIRLDASRVLSRQKIVVPSDVDVIRVSREGQYLGVGMDTRGHDMYELALVELLLSSGASCDSRLFGGIFAVDAMGIWFTETEGDIEDPVAVQRLIRHSWIEDLVLYQKTGSE